MPLRVAASFITLRPVATGSSSDTPATATIVLTREIRDASGRLKLTRDCASADELESEINVLQDELDELRQQAQRAFMVGVRSGGFRDGQEP